MSNAGQPIIIVKKKINHGGHHGGAWKVAYADFVTAMMAFFLVMWLVNQSKPVKAAIAGYFKDPALFEAGGGGRGVLPGGTAADLKPESAPSTEKGDQAKLETAVTRIRERLEQVPAFKKLRDQIEFSISAEGLRIDLLEKDDSTFFDSGSPSLRGESERVFGVIAQELAELDHDVAIEGHTDSRPYASSDRYSNWELSSDRANTVRRVMERAGLRGSQVSSVRGFADRQPRVSDPMDARNRRVTILVKHAGPENAPTTSEPAAARENAGAAEETTTPRREAPAKH